MNEAISLADSISSKSAMWVIVLLVICGGSIGWISFRYLVERYREANNALIECERSRSELILQMSREREKASAESSAKTEALVRDTLTTQQRIADTLDRFERALERLQDRTT